MRSTDRLPATNSLDLAIGLPLRNRDALQKLIGEIYDPKSPRYHQYLTPAQFSAQFGPTREQYEAVKNYARSNRLTIVGAHANRLVLDVNGAVKDVERAFSVHMTQYPHPTEARTFYAPDSEPTVAADLPILDVSGLDNYSAPRPLMHTAKLLVETTRLTPDGSGTGPQGTFIGDDFRTAYLPDIFLKGAGQSVALVEFDGYYPKDIAAYATNAQLPKVPLRNVLIDGFKGVPGKLNGEVALDIDMVTTMAPGLSNIIVYEAPNNKQSYNDVLNRIASDDSAAQISSSWRAPSGPNATTDEIFQEIAVQGQSFFQASGDGGAYTGPVDEPADNPYVTSVGGTSLSTAWWAGGGWDGESAWNLGGSNGGSGGGISTVYSIPAWQQGIDMSENQGSTTMRNLPDVAMNADNIYLIANNGKQFEVVGTSASAPLWAGFTALVNQQAASNGLPRIGFLNPALYTLAQGPNYSRDFHDVTGGDNTSTSSPNRFYATSGYDLCTGWGSPAGQYLIDDLTIQRSDFLITPASGFSAVGFANGPFNVTNQEFVLRNSGWLPCGWSLINTSLWINASLTSGNMGPGISSTISVSLTPAAYDLSAGVYDAMLIFSNANDGTLQSRSFTIEVVPSGAAQVTITPPAVASAGAQWQIDGGAWQNSGSTVSKIELGNHILSFSDVSGWITPLNQLIDIQSNATTTITANYSQEGSLQVTISPPSAISAGAQWQVDGGDWYDSGSTIFLVPGGHTISFKTVASWLSPTNETILVQPGAVSSINATYLPGGSLQVTVDPGYASWRLDGGPLQYGGSVSSVSLGTHTVTFEPFSGFYTPAPVTVSISQGQTNSVVENYAPETSSLQVLIYAAPIGLANVIWNVDGGPWQTNGATVSGLTAWEAYYANHMLTVATSDGVELFTESVPVFENQPTNLVTPVIPEPHAFSIIAGYDGWVGRADGTNSSARFAAPSGVTVDTQGNVFGADSGNSTIRKLTPVGTNWVVTTIAGQPGVVGSTDGTNNQTTFSSASGIAAGPDGELYVADSGNCTIRELIPSGTNWIASTIAGQAGNCGTNDGTGGVARFNDPTGLAVGADGSVYVADRNNCSIRKLTQAAGVWTVATIAGGTLGSSDGVGAQAQFYYPVAVTVNAAGTLYVADYWNEAIRELTPQGADYVVKTIAGNPSSFGEVDGVGTNSRFWEPQGITIDSSNNIYVADGPTTSAIRMLTPMGTNWLVSTISANVYDLAYAFDTPRGIVVDTNGNIFFASSGDDIIIKGWNVATGDLQVTIAPTEAINAGAQWQVDGGPWETNDATLIGLVAGTHVVTFSDVTGLNTPAPQTVIVTANQTAAAEGDYASGVGSLQVWLNPVGAVTNGAQWQVDNGPWQTNGATVLNLSYGHHLVSFLTVSNWASPPDQDVMIAGNYQTNVINAYYAGLVTANILTQAAIDAGAQWCLDFSWDWQTNGAILPATEGFHWVAYSTLQGWITPPSERIFVDEGSIARSSGAYEAMGSLQVNIEPTNAVFEGAVWGANGENYNSGTSIFIAPGIYTIWFGPANNWAPPQDLTVTVLPGQSTNVSVTYTQLYGAVSANLLPKTAAGAGAQWKVDSGVLQNSGATVPVLPGNHILGFKTITGWQTPSNQTVNVSISTTNSLTASYTLIESVPPTLTILTPSTNRPWAFPALTVVGTAQDNVGVASVYYRLNNGPWLPGNGTTNWAASVILSPGTNIVSAFAIDVNGNRSGTSSITASYSPSSRLTIGIAGSGTVSPNLSGELLLLGQCYTVKASPAKGSVFSNWTGNVNYDLPSLTFVMQSNMFVQANFVPSPFKSFAGKYTGLALETNGVPGTNSGQFTASLTSNGAFTAQLRSGALKLSFAGQFSVLGFWSNSIVQLHAPSIAGSLQLDMNGSGTVTGQFGNGTWNDNVLARRSGIAAGNAAPQTGKYMLFFSDSSRLSGNLDFGYGFGALSVNGLGIAHFNGQLTDGTRVTQGGAISEFGEWPFYAPLHGGTDYLAGWILFTNAPDPRLAGRIYRVKPAESNSPTEVLTPLDVFGSRIQSTNEAPRAMQR